MTHCAWDLPLLLTDRGLRAEEVWKRFRGSASFRRVQIVFAVKWHTSVLWNSGKLAGKDPSRPAASAQMSCSCLLLWAPSLQGSHCAPTVPAATLYAYLFVTATGFKPLVVLFVHDSLVRVGPFRVMFWRSCLYPILPLRLTSAKAQWHYLLCLTVLPHPFFWFLQQGT